MQSDAFTLLKNIDQKGGNKTLIILIILLVLGGAIGFYFYEVKLKIQMKTIKKANHPLVALKDLKLFTQDVVILIKIKIIGVNNVVLEELVNSFQIVQQKAHVVLKEVKKFTLVAVLLTN